VAGDKDHPLSRGFTCARGRMILEHLYHKDRINYPLKRKGEQGKNEWQRISWQQALDEIAEKLNDLKEKYGAETLAFSHGTYRTYGWPLKRFFNLFGSPNIMGAQNVCRCPGWTIEWATFWRANHFRFHTYKVNNIMWKPLQRVLSTSCLERYYKC